LRRPANAATLHPQTGRDHGLEDGDRATVKTATAAFPVQVIFDPAVMPGIIQMVAQAVSPASIRRA
ncbi:MAG: molybdopterin dinucleotide binding domain-containing protein, partial [Bryobacteraceae bacterium]